MQWVPGAMAPADACSRGRKFCEEEAKDREASFGLREEALCKPACEIVYPENGF